MAELADLPPMNFQTRVREASERFRGLPSNKKALLFGGVAAILSILVGVYLYTREPDYKILFSNLNDRDGGQITAALQQMKVPYQLGAGGVIEVPTSAVYDTRLKLASQGLPKASGAGFELMDNQKFGISQFAEQINYQRAIEGELARTIESLASVESARVHLAIPKQSVFLREQQQPSASVMVSLYGGRVLDSGQIAAIVNLVSSSVPGLSAKNITIVDQGGNLLSKHPDLDDGSNGLSQRQLNYVHQIEQNFVKRIETILEPIVGKGNAHAEVTAALDFSEVEQTSESHNPNTPPNQAAIRSQQTNESMSRENAPQGGVPGALSNQPPNAAAAPIQLPPGTQAGLMPAQQNGQEVPPTKSSKEVTTNYEVDKTIQHTRLPVGSIKRLSAAVVVNFKQTTTPAGETKMTPLSDREIQQIQNLVKESMGFSSERGDSLNVVNAAFADGPAKKKDLQQKALDYLTENAADVAKFALLALVLLYLLFGVIRPIVRDVVKPKELPLPEGMVMGPDGQLVAADSPEALGGEDASLDPREVARREYEAALESARQIVRSDPRMAAQIIKEWVNNDE